MTFVYDMIGADNAGENRHPQAVIREHFPDAHSFEPNPIRAVWVFEAADRPVLPSFIRRAHEGYGSATGGDDD